MTNNSSILTTLNKSLIDKSTIVNNLDKSRIERSSNPLEFEINQMNIFKLVDTAILSRSFEEEF